MMLSVERTGTVVWFTLQRPEKCNALSVELNQAITAACRAVPAGAAIVVLQGAGRHFCAGSDLLDLHQADRAQAERVLRLEIEACHALAALSQLTVAILHGKCRGGGAILPLYCDLRVGRSGVDFALPEVGLGWVPPYGVERLEAQMRRSFVLDLMLSGRACGDEEALRQGWLDVLTGAEPAEALAYVERLARLQTAVLKDAVGLVTPKNLSRMRSEDERGLAAFLDHFDTEHARRQIAGFVERKRS